MGRWFPAGAIRSSNPGRRTMKVSIIGCPFRTTYGQYIESLRSAMERHQAQVQWIASNCGCQDPKELARDFQSTDIDYFELPNEVGPWSVLVYSPETARRALKEPLRAASLSYRTSRYANLSEGADVVHVQQTLNAFGANSAFRILRRIAAPARVITLHELDPEQTARPELNAIYNLADAIVVHDSLMKKKIVAFGVSADLVHVVRCGTEIDPFDEPAVRDGLVFYGGHQLNKGKGLRVLLDAYLRLKQDLPTAPPRLRIHGHFGPVPADARDMVRDFGLVDDVEWLGDLSNDEIKSLYRRSQVCVLPYTGSFAGLPVGLAAANRLPVISTRYAGIPDHIGDLGIYVDGADPAELAARLSAVLGDAAMRAECGLRLRAHAERHLGWDTVAGDTLDVYRAAREQAQFRKLPDTERKVASMA